MRTPPVGAQVGALLLAVRATLLGAVVLAIAATSHASADGLLPGPGGLAALLVGVTALAAAFLRAPASRGRVVALVLGGQALVHGGLTAMAGHRGDADRPPTSAVADWQAALGEAAPSGRFREVMGALGPAPLERGVGGTGPDLGAGAHLVAHLGSASPAMLLAHTAGAVAVALWLAAGESALWSLVALTATLVRAAVATWLGRDPRPAVLGLPRALRPAYAARAVRRPRSRHHLVPCRRGPPLLAA